MKFLQLLIGGIHDAILDRPDRHRFLDAVFFACFGLFPNVATLAILLASGARYFFQINHEPLSFPGSKVLWLFLMGMIFVFLISSRNRIMVADRAQFVSRKNFKIFLISYYVLSYVALLGAYKLYAIV